MRPSKIFLIAPIVNILLGHAAVLTPELAIKVRKLSELTFSADGIHVACTVAEPPKGAEPKTHIWLLDR